MPTNILMPALSPTMEKGNLAKWLKKEGDVIKSGDVIAEIETDKATMEVEAVEEGTLARIVVPEGTADVAVNAVIGVIAAEGEDTEAVGAANAAAPQAEALKADAPAEAEAEAAAQKADAPASAEVSAPQGLAYERQPTGEPLAAEAEEPSPGTANGVRVFASPLARRLAKDSGLDLAGLKGSGPYGRIVERDVTAALAGGSKAAPAAEAPAPPSTPTPAAAAPTPDPLTPALPAAKPAGPANEAIKKMFPAGSFAEVPHDSMRKTIARRLVEAKSTIPHFYLAVDCDLDALMGLREQINAAAQTDKDGKSAYKVSVNDFVIKALALALIRVPDANVTWTEGAMLKHRQADIGVAVSIPGGLITPVIRAAETKTLSVISNEMKDYAARARARRLKPEEYTGGSSAVSNLGMFGVRDFAAIVNPPHATILAVGAGEKRVVVKNNTPAVATLMTVTLSTDHRAVDGALGAELISTFKTLIENPVGMLV